jgi:hypothetical protein
MWALPSIRTKAGASRSAICSSVRKKLVLVLAGEDFSGANNHNRLMHETQDLFGADRR